MSIFSNLFSLGAGKARDEAMRLGIQVADVERDIPIFSERNNFVNQSKGHAVRYSIPRFGPSGDATWKLLQRTKAQGATLANNYQLKSNSPLPDHRMIAFAKVAGDFPEEYFEFEGTPSEVVAYWEEWGGPKMALLLDDVLKRLASI